MLPALLLFVVIVSNVPVAKLNSIVKSLSPFKVKLLNVIFEMRLSVRSKSESVIEYCPP